MLLAAGFGTTALAQDPPAGFDRVYWDTVNDAGELTGGVLYVPAGPAGEMEGLIRAPVTTLHRRDASTNRLNLVCVGDGYQASQMGTYATHAQNAVNRFLAQEPFKTYATLINVYRVDVVSTDSGVDNDPSQGISKSTAMDMGFWCGGTERALCVSVSKAKSYANNAPARPDQILAIANSSKYGGVGYPDRDVGTLAGGNSSAAEIAIHEMGHSLGNLADEYDYEGPETYTGPEPSDVNASKLTAAGMLAAGTKWAPWLGYSHPSFDGMISAYEGCMYSVYGLYRPTNNSKMRSLGRPFNLPSAEALIIELYKIVRPIDSSTSTAAPLSRTDTIFVDPVDPVGNRLAVQWSLDGVDIPGATSTSLELCPLQMSVGTHLVRATVVDNTFMVRNQAARAQYLTQMRTWVVIAAAHPADLNQDGLVDFADYLQFLDRYDAGDLVVDFNHDGLIDFGDYLEFINQFDTAC